MIHVGKRGKLNPRYIVPVEILTRIDLVAYRLQLPPELNNTHPMFPVSNLNKCLSTGTLVVPFNESEINENLHPKKEHVGIVDRESKE